MNEFYLLKQSLSKSIGEKYFNDKDLISIYDIVDLLENVVDDYEKLQEEFEDYKQYVESNFKEMSQAEQIGWNENW